MFKGCFVEYTLLSLSKFRVKNLAHGCSKQKLIDETLLHPCRSYNFLTKPSARLQELKIRRRKPAATSRKPKTDDEGLLQSRAS
jgi:hypothetical protein